MQTTFPLHSPDFYAGDPYPAYRELRASSPVCWNDVAKFWAPLKYDDVRFVSSNPAVFISTKGITIPDPELPNRRRVAVLEATIREIVRGILDGLEPGSVHEFAEQLAAPLPTRMIAELIGAPPDDWEQCRAWSDAAIGIADPEIELDPMVALGQLYAYFEKLIAARRIDARDDLLSVLAGAQIDGHRLTDSDLLNFAFLLLVAGNETTRNLIALAALEQPRGPHGAHRDDRRRDTRSADRRGRRGGHAVRVGQPGRGRLRARRRRVPGDTAPQPAHRVRLR